MIGITHHAETIVLGLRMCVLANKMLHKWWVYNIISPEKHVFRSAVKGGKFKGFVEELI